MFLPISAIFLFVFGFTPPADAVKYYWTSELIENIGAGVSSNGIARDPGNGTIYVTYFNSGSGLNDVRLATKSSGLWSIQSIVTLAGWNDLKRDSSGNLHLVYYKSGTLRYRFKPSAGSWTVEETANATTISGQFLSMELDASGNPHVPLNQSAVGGNTLRHDFKSSGAWSDELVASNTYPEYPDMAFDNSGVAYIAYTNNPGGGYELRVASNPGGTWSTNELVASSNSPRWPSLAIDSSGKLHLSYGLGSLGGLKYASKPSGGSWTIETVDAIYGAYTEMALNPNGNPVILYQDTNGYLKMAMKSGGSWSVTNVGSEKADMVSMALDSSGNIYAVYNSYVGVSMERFAVGEAGNTSTDKDGVLINLTDEASSLSGYSITYDDITADGRTRVLARTTATSGSNSFLSDPEVGYMLDNTVRNITKEDVTYLGGFSIRIPYDPADIPVGFTEDQLRLYHYLSSGNVEDITTLVNTTGNYVVGYATSFSDFGVGVQPEPATLLLLGSALVGLLPLRKRFFQK